MYLLICIDTISGTPELVQLDVTDFKSDQILFSKLRLEYRARRGKWLELISLRSLREIKFVQFELWESGEVDILDHSDERMLPPSQRDEYCYFPKPASSLPPIGSNRLTHFFDFPGHPDSKSRTCWSRFPKRRKERLYVGPSGTAVGWGIHLVEGPNIILIWALIFCLFGLGTFVFAIAYTVLDHDVQSGFTVASYVVSFATLSIGACSVSSRRISRSSRRR